MNPCRGLYRFDLSALAGQYISINSVSFSATQVGDAAGSGTAYIFALKQANADWVEGAGNGANALPGEHCWNEKIHDGNYSFTGTPWAGGVGAGGAMGNTCTDPLVPNDDYDHVPLASYDWSSADLKGEEITWNLAGHAGLTLTDLVDLWSGPEANNAGFVMMSNDLSGVTSKHIIELAANEHSYPEGYALPKLTVDYVVPEPASALIVALGFAGTALRRGRK